jgi:hypothetical protein
VLGADAAHNSSPRSLAMQDQIRVRVCRREARTISPRVSPRTTSLSVVSTSTRSPPADPPRENVRGLADVLERNREVVVSVETVGLDVGAGVRLTEGMLENLAEALVELRPRAEVLSRRSRDVVVERAL